MGAICTTSTCKESTEIETIKAVLEIANTAFGTAFHASDFPHDQAEGLGLRQQGGVSITLNKTDHSSTEIIIDIGHASVGTFRLEGMLKEPPSSLLDRLATTTSLAIEQKIQLVQRTSEVEFLAMQVSQDFEELAWLRECGVAIQSLGAKSPTVGLAQSILDSLVQLLQADQIAMATYVQPVDVDEEMAFTNACEVVSFGADEFEPDAIREIFEKFGYLAIDRPYVTNALLDLYSEHNIELILVPIRIEAKVFGWLVAFQSIPSEVVSSGRQIREPSFGSFEAGLLGSAASFLASFEQSRLLIEEQEDLLIGVVRALVNTIDAKDPYTCGHSDRVASISRIIGEQYGLDAVECEQIHLAGLLHDIGKIGVPDAVLLKPGELDDDEFEQLKQHPVIGYQVLKNLKQMSFILEGVLHHHESLDGSGYPDGLAGYSIPLAARIIAVADAFDAMTSDRPYRAGMPPQQAEQILRENAGPQWDPQILAAFFAGRDEIHAVCFDYEQQSDNVADELVSPLATSVFAVNN